MKSIMLITPEQIRAARALLRLEQDELARRANVSVVTVRRLEAPAAPSKVTRARSTKSSGHWKRLEPNSSTAA